MFWLGFNQKCAFQLPIIPMYSVDWTLRITMAVIRYQKEVRDLVTERSY